MITESNAALSNAIACYDELQTTAGLKYQALQADIKEWSDIAYELWALACNSTTDGHSSEEEWEAARKRLGDRFHAALAKLPDEPQP